MVSWWPDRQTSRHCRRRAPERLKLPRVPKLLTLAAPTARRSSRAVCRSARKITGQDQRAPRRRRARRRLLHRHRPPPRLTLRPIASRNAITGLSSTHGTLPKSEGVHRARVQAGCNWVILRRGGKGRVERWRGGCRRNGCALALPSGRRSWGVWAAMDDAKRSVNCSTRDFLAAWWRGDAGPVPCATARRAAITRASLCTRSAIGNACPTCWRSGTPMANWCSNGAQTAPAFTSGSGAAPSMSTGLRFAGASTAAPFRRWA